jgi:hypothetical protein
VLREGIKDENGVFRGGYVYQRDAYMIFDTYFLQNNPFFDIIDPKGSDIEGSLFGSAFGGANQPKQPAP